MPLQTRSHGKKKEAPLFRKGKIHKTEPDKIPDHTSSSEEDDDKPEEVNDTSYSSLNDSFKDPIVELEASKCSEEQLDVAKKSSYCFICFIMGTLVVLAISLFLSDFCKTLHPYLPWMDEVHHSRLSLYKEDINEIKKAFPSQHSRLWKTIRLDTEGNLKLEDPHQPSILMLASDEDGYPTAQCLSSKLSEAFSRGCQRHIVVDGSSLSGLTPDVAKLRIDDEITRGFRQGACSVVVSHFEEIPSFATNVFYQFCENDNAPFRNVSIIFNVQVQPVGDDGSNSNLSKYPAKWDRVLDDFLTRSLQHRDPKRMTQDMIGGLLSRITPSVVWVGKEERLSSC